MRKLYMIGDITWEAFEAFSKDLDSLREFGQKNITLELASAGGDAHAALAFYSKIRNFKGDIAIQAVGQVASAAVLILAAGDIRSMDYNAWVMVHEDTGDTSGSMHQQKIEIQQAFQLEKQWSEILATCTDETYEFWRKAHKRTTYMTAQECLKVGLVDELF